MIAVASSGPFGGEGSGSGDPGVASALAAGAAAIGSLSEVAGGIGGGRDTSARAITSASTLAGVVAACVEPPQPRAIAQIPRQQLVIVAREAVMMLFDSGPRACFGRSPRANPAMPLGVSPPHPEPVKPVAVGLSAPSESRAATRL
jgi:hypothetical protein